MSYNDLENFYRTQFQLHQDFNYPIDVQEAWVPWEREIHIALVEERAREMEENDAR